MNFVIYWLGRGLVAGIGALPLTWMAWVGRRAGGLCYHLDGRHRRVALRNLTMCFGADKSAAEIRAIARENFRRLGESYVCMVKTYQSN